MIGVSNLEWMELYRTMVPGNRIINDNHGQHYRTHMGNIEFLTEQFDESLKGKRTYMIGRGANRHEVIEEIIMPGGFVIPEKKDVHNFIGVKWQGEYENREMTVEECEGINVFLRFEVWRMSNRVFDPQNYSKTFKAPLDMLVHYGYLPDDSWKYVIDTMFSGGGIDAWKDPRRHFLHGIDGLPEDISAKWWRDSMKGCGLEVTDGKEDFNGILIRILVKKG